MTERATVRRRLGRGLEALLGPTTTTEAAAQGSLVQIPVAQVRPNPYQPRRAIDPDALAELAGSLQSAGLLQPIVVRRAETGGGYELIVGERRLRAAEHLGWREIGAVVRDVDDRTLLPLALVENLQRAAPSPIAGAPGYQPLGEEFGGARTQLASPA